MGTFEEKVKQCITRAKAMVSRVPSMVILYHKVDTDGTLAESKLQEFEIAETNLVEHVVEYVRDHAAEYSIQQQYAVKVFEKDAAEDAAFATVEFRVRGANSAGGESMPANAHGMIRMNMQHTEFFARWAAERTERSAQVVESVMTKALARAERETRRWRRRALDAENALRTWLKTETDQMAARAKAELESINTRHMVATRQRFADEAIKLFPMVASSITGYVARKLKGGDKKVLALPQGLAPSVKETAKAAAEEAKRAADKPSEESVEANEKILELVRDLAANLTQDEVVAIATAVKPDTWKRLEALFHALKESNDEGDEGDD